jgi:hypothetical protein
MFAFNASFTHMVQWDFFQIHVIHHGIQLLKPCHVEMAKFSCQSISPSSKEFAMCAMSFRTFTLKRYKFLSLRASATTTI